MLPVVAVIVARLSAVTDVRFTSPVLAVRVTLRPDTSVAVMSALLVMATSLPVPAALHGLIALDR